MSRSLRVFFAHNYYRFGGGEDVVFSKDASLLADHGHEVTRFTVTNRDLRNSQLPRAAVSTLWSRSSYRQVRDQLRTFQPDVAHFHNIFPQLSPSVYHACREAGVPVVQTLHNYRLICPQGGLYRSGTPCELCVGSLHHSLVHSCYRSNPAATAVVTSMLKLHRMAGTWESAVDRYLVLTDFMKEKLSNSGHLPVEKLIVRPNYLYPDPGPGKHDGENALYVGQLSEPKGVLTLIDAWKRLPSPPVLKIVGDGPLAAEVESLVARHPDLNIDLTGRLDRREVVSLMQSSAFLVFPSRWYEAMPLVLLEAQACGLPVIASDGGAMREMIAHGETGLRFTPGDSADLAARVEELRSAPDARDRFGRNARRTFERKYTAEKGYASLMAVYEGLLDER